MTKEQFLNVTIKDISQVYSGKNHHCRCGCGGDYVATSYMVKPRSEVNDSLVAKRLAKAKRIIESNVKIDGEEIGYNETYINIPIGKNRALTFYFDEVAR